MKINLKMTEFHETPDKAQIWQFAGGIPHWAFRQKQRAFLQFSLLSSQYVLSSGLQGFKVWTQKCLTRHKPLQGLNYLFYKDQAVVQNLSYVGIYTKSCYNFGFLDLLCQSSRGGLGQGQEIFILTKATGGPTAGGPPCTWMNTCAAESRAPSINPL